MFGVFSGRTAGSMLSKAIRRSFVRPSRPQCIKMLNLRSLYPFLSMQDIDALTDNYNQLLKWLDDPAFWNKEMEPSQLIPNYLFNTYKELKSTKILPVTTLFDIVAPDIKNMMPMSGHGKAYREYRVPFSHWRKERESISIIGLPPKFLQMHEIELQLSAEVRKFGALIACADAHAIYNGKKTAHGLKPSTTFSDAYDRCVSNYNIALREARFPLPITTPPPVIVKNALKGQSVRRTPVEPVIDTTTVDSTIEPYYSPDIIRYANEKYGTEHPVPVSKHSSKLMMTYKDADEYPVFTPERIEAELLGVDGPPIFPALACLRIPVKEGSKFLWTVESQGFRSSPPSYVALEKLLIGDPAAKLIYFYYTTSTNRAVLEHAAQLIRSLHSKYTASAWTMRYARMATTLRPGAYAARVLDPDRKSWHTWAEVKKYHATGMPKKYSGKVAFINFLSRQNDGANFYKHLRTLRPSVPLIDRGKKSEYRKRKGQEHPDLPLKILPIVSSITLKHCDKLRKVFDGATDEQKLYLHHAFCAGLSRQGASSLYPSAPAPAPAPTLRPLTFDDIFDLTHAEMYAKVGFQGTHQGYEKYIKSLPFSRAAAFEDVNYPDPKAFAVGVKKYDAARNKGQFSRFGTPAIYEQEVIIPTYRGRDLYTLRYFSDHKALGDPKTDFNDYVAADEYGARMIMPDDVMKKHASAFIKDVKAEHETKMLEHGTFRDLFERVAADRGNESNKEHSCDI